LRLECAVTDVPAVVHAFEMNLAHGFIGALERAVERVGCGRNRQHPASASEIVTVDQGGARMEDFNAAGPGSVVETGDAMSGSITARIAV